jgi:DNA-binding transcriptional MerR regulator
VTSRTYLSIGDVLTLLREEFPDVTISKIRFLESQGLVNPERSPSGYRKFFDHDVERLRWVLRQQREHFLPLKVIRDRLASGELEDPGADPPNGKQARHAPSGAVTGSPAPAPVGAAAQQPTKADEEAMARILADASRRTARLPEEVQARRGLQVVGDGEQGAPAAADAAAAVAGPERVQPAPRTTTAGGHRPERAASARAGARGDGSNGASLPAGAEASTQAGAAAAQAEAAESAARTGGTGGREARARKGPAHASDKGGTGAGAGATGGSAGTIAAGVVTGSSLTAEELAAASGLTSEELAGLVSFGLLESVMVAGIATYDEEALTVANLAASFRAFGIEPRHLRLYRNGADREMGLIEQVVIPLLRQRNPESRQRAMEAADELAGLGQSMRATLVRSALRRHLGG